MKIYVNGEAAEVNQGATIADALVQLELAEQKVAIEVNLQVVPRQRRGQWVLQEGDKMEIVTFVGGG